MRSREIQSYASVRSINIRTALTIPDSSRQCFHLSCVRMTACWVPLNYWFPIIKPLRNGDNLSFMYSFNSFMTVQQLKTLDTDRSTLMRRLFQFNEHKFNPSMNILQHFLNDFVAELVSGHTCSILVSQSLQDEKEMLCCLCQ